MRWAVYAVAALTALVGVCSPEARAQAVPTANGNAARPAPPEVGAPPKEEEPSDGGSLTGIVANDGPRSASFVFGDKPPDLHYTYFFTINDVEIYFVTHDRLELVGSDKTDHYWHYRSLRPDVPSRPFPKDWYIPKDVFKHPAVWFQTQEPAAEIQYYGKAVGYVNMGWPTKEMIAKPREIQATEKGEEK